jgi:hypothetical protein
VALGKRLLAWRKRERGMAAATGKWRRGGAVAAFIGHRARVLGAPVDGKDPRLPCPGHMARIEGRSTEVGARSRVVIAAVSQLTLGHARVGVAAQVAWASGLTHGPAGARAGPAGVGR